MIQTDTMTAEVAPANGADGNHKEDEEKVPQTHADAEEDGDDAEEDGAPEVAGAGAFCIFILIDIIECGTDQWGACAYALNVQGIARKRRKRRNPRRRPLRLSSSLSHLGLDCRNCSQTGIILRESCMIIRTSTFLTYFC